MATIGPQPIRINGSIQLGMSDELAPSIENANINMPVTHKLQPNILEPTDQNNPSKIRFQHGKYCSVCSLDLDAIPASASFIESRNRTQGVNWRFDSALEMAKIFVEEMSYQISIRSSSGLNNPSPSFKSNAW